MSAEPPPGPPGPPGRAGNVLGALSLVLADRMAGAVTAGGQSPTSAAALSALAQFLGGCTIDRLRRALGLTSSGTVRLVDRLEADGLVRRGPGDDGRSTSLTLTAAGKRAARRISAARAAVLEDALAALPPADRDAFERLTADVLAGIAADKATHPDGSGWICRLCDLPACGRDAGSCPAATAARAALRGQTP